MKLTILGVEWDSKAEKNTSVTEENEFIESPKQKFERELREFEGKNIQDYYVRLNAWFSTKLEKDKSLLTISSAAVGLLVSIITAKGVQDYYQIIFYSLALLGFLIAIITVVNIFDKNAEQIEKNLMDESHINTTLSKYDMTLACSFYIGIFFTILIGISYGVNQYVRENQNTFPCQKQGGNMSDEKDKSTKQKPLNENFKESNNIKVKPPTTNTDQPKKDK